MWTSESVRGALPIVNGAGFEKTEVSNHWLRDGLLTFALFPDQAGRCPKVKIDDAVLPLSTEARTIGVPVAQFSRPPTCHPPSNAPSAVPVLFRYGLP